MANRPRRPPRPPLVEWANATFPIAEVFNRLTGNTAPTGIMGSWKTYCPWGQMHADGGTDKGMRLYYESNTAYCHLGCGFYTPTKMWAQARQVTDLLAAEQMAAEFGVELPKPKPPAERFAEALAVRSQARQGALADLVEALLTAVRAECAGGTQGTPAAMMRVELDPRFTQALEEQLGELAAYEGSPPHTAWDHRREWYLTARATLVNTAKTLLREVVREQEERRHAAG